MFSRLRAWLWYQSVVGFRVLVGLGMFGGAEICAIMTGHVWG